jgi:hypothetical protein
MTLRQWARRDPDDERKINYETTSGHKFTSDGKVPAALSFEAVCNAKILKKSIKKNEHYIVLDI